MADSTAVHMRSTNDHQSVLTFSRQEWGEFIAAVKCDELIG
jgi:hypothetical protein